MWQRIVNSNFLNLCNTEYSKKENLKINNCFNFIFRIAQPQFLGSFIAYFIPNQSNLNKDHALCVAAGTILCSFLPVLVFHPFFLYVLNIGQRIRIACCSLLYHKVTYNIISYINNFYWGNTKFYWNRWHETIKFVFTVNR